MTATAWVSVGELVLNVVGLTFVAFQVYLGRRQLTVAIDQQTEERQRTRRQETLHFLMNTLENRRELLQELPDEHDVDGMKAYAEKLVDNFKDRDQRVLLPYLGHYEDLAVALRSDVYDLLLVDAMHGRRIVNVWQSYEPFIRWYQDEIKDPAYLWTFEKLYGKIRLIEEKYKGMAPSLKVEYQWRDITRDWVTRD